MAVKVGFHGKMRHALAACTWSCDQVLLACCARNIQLEFSLKMHPGEHSHDGALQPCNSNSTTGVWLKVATHTINQCVLLLQRKVDTFISVAEQGEIAIRSNRLCFALPDPRFCCSAIRGAPSLSATVKFSSKTLGLGSVMVSLRSREYRSAVLSLGLACLLPTKQANGPPCGFRATHKWPLCGSKQHCPADALCTGPELLSLYTTCSQQVIYGHLASQNCADDIASMTDAAQQIYIATNTSQVKG